MQRSAPSTSVRRPKKSAVALLARLPPAVSRARVAGGGERKAAVTSVFAELRHAAAAVRATQDCASLREFEASHAAAYAAWTEARSRTATYLLEQHALQQEHLQARNCACFCRASHADVGAR